MKRLISALIVTMLLVTTLTGCGSKQNPLVGKWVEDVDQGETLELFSDGTGVMSNSTVTYSVSTWIAENNRLKVTVQVPLMGETSAVYDYEIKGKTLTLTWDEGSITYQKEN